MSNEILTAKIKELQELEQLQTELKAEIESIKDEIKGVMVERNTEELVVKTDNQEHIVRFTTVLSQRFDSTQLKKKLPEIYKAYLKQVESRRFSIS